MQCFAHYQSVEKVFRYVTAVWLFFCVFFVFFFSHEVQISLKNIISWYSIDKNSIARGLLFMG